MTDRVEAVRRLRQIIMSGSIYASPDAMTRFREHYALLLPRLPASSVDPVANLAGVRLQEAPHVTPGCLMGADLTVLPLDDLFALD